MAEVGDWIIGMGGGRLRATGRCIFAMRVTRKLTFDQYWLEPAYIDKKPVRNGSRKMMVGDNIYSHSPTGEGWWQADSHHTNPDGSVNLHNLRVDTKSDKVLLSEHFFYFGTEAPVVPIALLEDIGFKNQRSYRVFDTDACSNLIEWLHSKFSSLMNMVVSDPFDFDKSEKHYSAGSNKVY
jgi:hypothetical protein